MVYLFWNLFHQVQALNNSFARKHTNNTKMYLISFANVIRFFITQTLKRFSFVEIIIKNQKK